MESGLDCCAAYGCAGETRPGPGEDMGGCLPWDEGGRAEGMAERDQRVE